MIAASLAACDRNVPEPDLDRPLVHVLATDPSRGTQGFPTERAIQVRFDRFLSPTSVLRQSVLVTPGLIDPASGEATAGSYFLEPEYNPYDRVATFRLPSGGRWTAGVVHTVRVAAPADEYDATGIKAFDGAPLDAFYDITFSTGPTVSDPAHNLDDARPSVGYCSGAAGPPKLPAVRSVLGACVGCHSGGSAHASAGLDLSGVRGLVDTAIGRLAREAPPIDQPGQTTSNPDVFGEGMPLIDPRNPGNSYLVNKLLVNRANYPAPGQQVADPDWDRGLGPMSAPADAELERLREALVRLAPMPLGPGLSPSEMRALVVWIANGAEVSDCP